MADNAGPLVRVYRADGTGMKLSRRDAEAFVAANPGAHIEGEDRVVAEGTVGDDGEAKGEAKAATRGRAADAGDAKGGGEAKGKSGGAA